MHLGSDFTILFKTFALQFDVERLCFFDLDAKNDDDASYEVWQGMVLHWSISI